MVCNLDIVVVAIAAAVDGAHLAAADVHSRVAVDPAAHVVAAIDGIDAAVVGVVHLDIGHALHVGHAAAAIEVALHDGIRALHLHVGRHTEDIVAAAVGQVDGVLHGAGVAAAIDVAHLAFQQAHFGHVVRHGHHVAVVAAEDGTHIAACGVLCIEQHHHLVAHAHAVAAAEDGVDDAAGVGVRGVQVDEARRLDRAIVAATQVAVDQRLAVLRIVAVIVVGSIAAAVDVVDVGAALDAHIRRVGRLPFAVYIFIELGGVVGGREGAVGHPGSGILHFIFGAEGLDSTHTVVAGVEAAVDDAVARDKEVGEAVDGGHVAATEDVAVHRAAIHRQVHRAVTGAAVAHVGQVGATVGVAVHRAAQHQQVGVLVGRYVEACIVVIVVKQLAVGVAEAGRQGILAVHVAVVVTVAAGKDVGLHRAAGHHHEGAFGRVVLGADAAADVAAAEEGADGAVGHLDIGRVGDIGQTAATVEVVNLHVGTVDQHGGAELGGGIDDASLGEVGRHGAGGGYRCRHGALVAAAIDGADAAAGKGQRGHHGHSGQVVAAEEAAHVVAVLAAHPVATAGGVGEFLGGAARAVDRHRGALHRGAVATGKAGVDAAAHDGHIHQRHIHHVAAAEEVADAEVTAEAGEVGVHALVALRSLAGGKLGVVDGDGHLLARGERAAHVVAAEDGIGHAVVVFDGRHIVAGIIAGEEGVAGTAEEGVHLHQVVVHHHLGVGDAGDVAAVGHILHNEFRGAAPLPHVAFEPCALAGSFHEVVGGALLILVVVVAVAAAVDRADEHTRRGGGAAQGHQGAVAALHAAADVVAAVDVGDGVAVVHRHSGVARHVGHTAAAEHAAAHHRCIDGIVHHRRHLGAHRDVHSHLLGGTVGELHGHRQGGDEGGRRHRDAAHRGEGVGVFLADAQVTARTVVEAVGDTAVVAVDGQRLGGGCGQGVAVVHCGVGAVVGPIDMLFDGRHTGIAEAGGIAMLVGEVEAAAAHLLEVFVVGGDDRHVDRGGDGGRGLQALAIFEGRLGGGAAGLGQGQGRQAQVLVAVLYLFAVRHILHRQEQSTVIAHLGGVGVLVAVVAPAGTRLVSVQVGLRVGALIGGPRQREAPTAVEDVPRQPEVVALLGTVDLVGLVQCGAQVPVVPLADAADGLAHLDLHHLQTGAAQRRAALQVVAIVVVLLVVVARQTVAARPHAVLVKRAGILHLHIRGVEPQVVDTLVAAVGGVDGVHTR